MIGIPVSFPTEQRSDLIAIDRIVVTGGGTAGHVYPALPILAEIKSTNLWIGSVGGRERALIEQAGIDFVGVPTGAILGRSPIQVMRSGLANIAGIRAAMTALQSFKPNVVLGTGGFVTVPTIVAARLLGIPSALFLPDVEPGLAIKWLSRITNRVVCTSEESRKYLSHARVEVTGYPVRETLRQWSTRPRQDAFAAFGLSPDRPVILIFGGSSGARAINRATSAALREILAVATVIHVTGEADREQAEWEHQSLPKEMRQFYLPYAYLHDEMGAAFLAADLVICRAGASTLGELPAFGVPSILIPGTFASGHQGHNADALVRTGAAIRINESDLDVPNLFAQQALALIRDSNRLQSMSKAARHIDRPTASRAIALVLKDLEKTH